MNWFEIKDWLEQFTGLDRDSLHIYGAVGLQLIFAVILRRPLASVWPWTLVFGVVLLNEYGDLSQFESWQSVPEISRNAVILDLWNSMLLPTILMLFARFSPASVVHSPKTKLSAQNTGNQQDQPESELS